MIEAKMRGEIFHLTTERDDCVAQLQASERRIQLVQSELQSTKQRLTSVEQAKMQVERDHRSVQSVVSSLQGSVNIDVDYYKRKVHVSRFTTM
jgi:chromosome segregation ATPase